MNEYDPAAEYANSELKAEMDAQLRMVPTNFQAPVFHGVYPLFHLTLLLFSFLPPSSRTLYVLSLFPITLIP